MVALLGSKSSWLAVTTSTRLCPFSAELVDETKYVVSKVVGETREKSGNPGRDWEFFNHFECRLGNGDTLCPLKEMVDDK